MATAGLEDVVTLVRGGAALGNMVVTGHRNDTAPGRGARHIGVLEDIRAAVHTRALAIPNAKNAVVFVAAGGRKTELLGAPQGGGRQLFIDAGLKHDVLGLEVFLGLDQCLVIAAQRGTTVAADKAGRVLAELRIAHALQHGQAHQRLHATHKGGACF
jgi:hypothetical protein